MLQSITTSNELLDVLDENGRKTGQIKNRSEVHRDGNWHRTMHIWAFNDRDEILLQRRSLNKDSSPGMLSISCAGHLRAGDDSLSCAIREFKEELDLDITPNDLQFVGTSKNVSRHSNSFINNEHCDLYFVRIDKTISDMQLQKEELSEAFFVPYAEFKQMTQDKQADLVIHADEFEIMFDYLDRNLSKTK